MQDKIVAIAISRACTGGSQNVPDVASRIAQTLGRSSSRHITAMAVRYLEEFGTGAAPRERDVLQFVLRDQTWLWRIRKRPTTRPMRAPAVRSWPLQSPQMHAVSGAAAWQVPRIETTGDLAAWLGLSVAEVEWFADVKGLLRKTTSTRLPHYHYRIVRKTTGAIRLIEAPQQRLKTIQRQILTGILEHVPHYYWAAHGFVKGRSVRTFAEPHVGHDAVIRLDLKNFFPTIGYARVHALFRTLGYPDDVASALAGICTNAAPRRLFAKHSAYALDLKHLADARELYTRPHLPQGAPTSPLIANMCAFRLDCRLTGLADWAGAVYTRYADDIAISGNGDFARHAQRYAAQASAIALDEGWVVQHHKTKIMHASSRQQLAGVVVNRTLNINREHFDQLKAILTNCVHHGPSSQNHEGRPSFEEVLRGRVSWVSSLNAQRGAKLMKIFDRIDWAR